MRVAVVTGASSGIGAALCRELRARGWHTVGLSRRPAPDADEHEECDVTDREMVDTVAKRVLERHPRIDLLVNNAGIPVRGNFLDSEPKRIEAAIQTNYLGSVWTLLAFLPGLGEGSTLVNVVVGRGRGCGRTVLRLEARAARVFAIDRSRAGAARNLRHLRAAGLRRDARVPARGALSLSAFAARRQSGARRAANARRGRAPPARDLRAALVPAGGLASDARARMLMRRGRVGAGE